MVKTWIMMGLVVILLTGCSSQSAKPDSSPAPEYTPFLAEQEGELRLVVLVQEKVQEETRAVNDMVAAMAGRFTPVIYDVKTEEGRRAALQLQTNSREYPAYYLFNNHQLLAQGYDLSQIAQAAMDYTDRLSVGGASSS
ncbi:hypothetical protein SAMN05216378_4357 [Paenibacillus catalpae]|uniref:DUF4358 domain-containing protein n=1 Tax=Paenibacillus catalpae TaxID=1045775 RepID=A0A1I2E010_9BACL|nr:hypothetical protein [Paenibacillus catalpae]SFE85881.1 hypothetical protein SAMN05216378_4357 [Paenibacillus catalpae]